MDDVQKANDMITISFHTVILTREHDSFLSRVSSISVMHIRVLQHGHLDGRELFVSSVLYNCSIK